MQRKLIYINLGEFQEHTSEKQLLGLADSLVIKNSWPLKLKPNAVPAGGDAGRLSGSWAEGKAGFKPLSLSWHLRGKLTVLQRCFGKFCSNPPIKVSFGSVYPIRLLLNCSKSKMSLVSLCCRTLECFQIIFLNWPGRPLPPCLVLMQESLHSTGQQI